jgi:hypothetical protein
MWILLVIALPSENATTRTRLWRGLKALGAASLRDGVWLLPNRPELAAALAAQSREATEAGGQAWALTLAGMETRDAEFRGMFDRGDEYADLSAALDGLAGVAEDAALRRGLRQLRKRFEAIAAIDYFPTSARDDSERRLLGLEAELRRRSLGGEPGFAAGDPERLDVRHYQGKLWATRRNLWVDRLASAWLIRRFIDPKARFLWLEHPEDCPQEALGFDFDGAAFTHVGRRVTFETLLASFGLEGDAALMRLGAVVHSLDVGGGAPEAAGVEALLKGLKARVKDDDRLLAEGGRLLDDLYAAFAEKNGERT